MSRSLPTSNAQLLHYTSDPTELLLLIIYNEHYTASQMSPDAKSALFAHCFDRWTPDFMLQFEKTFNQRHANPSDNTDHLYTRWSDARACIRSLYVVSKKSIALAELHGVTDAAVWLRIKYGIFDPLPLPLK